MNLTLINAADLLAVAHEQAMSNFTDAELHMGAPDFADENHAAFSQVWGSFGAHVPVRMDDDAYGRAVEFASQMKLYWSAMETAIKNPAR